MPEPVITKFLAIYGALLASITFGWNLLRDLKDRPDVRITAMIGEFVAEHGIPGSRLEPQLVVTITNVGRRPVFIKGWGGDHARTAWKDHRKSFLIIPRSAPKMLNEGEYIIEYTRDLGGCLSDYVTSLYAWDSTGRHWKLPSRQLRQLKREYTHMVEDEKA